MIYAATVEAPSHHARFGAERSAIELDDIKVTGPR